jgi:catechol 2,3-dioxygenase-like lactoylglutathione lyase family enzyme
VIRSIEIGVSDSGRAAAFYFELLGLSRSDVDLVQVDADGRGPLDQPEHGILHAAWVVESVDGEARRLREAGVDLAVEPRDGTAVERLAFLRDPDGALLELVQGRRRYQRVLEPELVAAERARAQSLPALDHVAVTAHLGQTIDFYRTHFGYPAIGENELGGGTVATYLDTGGAALEVFSTAAAAAPTPPRSEGDLGIRRVRIDSAAGVKRSLADPGGAQLLVRRAE